jgi:hypothetical protein
VIIRALSDCESSEEEIVEMSGLWRRGRSKPYKCYGGYSVISLASCICIIYDSLLIQLFPVEASMDHVYPQYFRDVTRIVR